MRPLIDPREQIERAIGETEGIVTPRMLADSLALMVEQVGENTERGRRALAIERWLRKLPDMQRAFYPGGTE